MMLGVKHSQIESTIELSNRPMVKIVKRDGRVEPFDVRKIQTRIEALIQDLPGINLPEIVGLTAARVHDGITAEELDNYSAEIAATRSIVHNSYAVLASRLAVS